MMGKLGRGLIALAMGLIALAMLLTIGCGSGGTGSAIDHSLKVVATTTILRDLAQRVAGSRFQVTGLILVGAEPHEWQPNPADMATATESDLLIVNGGRLETALVSLMESDDMQDRVVTASAGLPSRAPRPGEPGYGDTGAIDAHWWLDPIAVITYVNNIKDALVAADAAGASVYEANGAAYIRELEALDAWVREQVTVVPESQRLLVMNHLSHGYFADRYGFQVVGAVIPSVSNEAQPTPGELADLIATIRTLQVKAIFVELGESPQLAEEIAHEVRVRVVTDLLDHSLTEVDGPAPDYLSMMRHNTQLIVDNLK